MMTVTTITRRQVEQVFRDALNAPDLARCELAAITEAYDHAGASDPERLSARAPAEDVAEGLRRLASDLLAVAAELDSVAGASV